MHNELINAFSVNRISAYPKQKTHVQKLSYYFKIKCFIKIAALFRNPVSRTLDF